MRTISLHQPWATAVALGSKRVETRSWATDYRGPLAIHAAKRKVVDELIIDHSTSSWHAALREHEGWAMSNPDGLHIRSGFGLPFGAVVAVCDLVDCRPTGSFTNEELDTPRLTKDGQRLPEFQRNAWHQWTERHMGNFELGRFGWMLENIRPLKTPLPWKGLQGFFQVPTELIEAAL